MFLLAIAWPMIELALAIFVIGLMIWVLGIIAQRNNGQAIDILGFGLIGNRGLLIYTNFIIAVGLVIAGLIVAIRRGVLWTRPLQHAVMQIPGIGSSLEKIALARLTWALHLTMNVDMDLRQVVPLVLRATGSDYYIQHTHEVVSLVAAGHPLHEAFGVTGVFPDELSRSARGGRGKRRGRRVDGAALETLRGRSPAGPQGAHHDRRRRRGAARDGADHPDDLPHRRLLHRHDQRRAQHDATRRGRDRYGENFSRFCGCRDFLRANDLIVRARSRRMSASVRLSGEYFLIFSPGL